MNNLKYWLGFSKLGFACSQSLINVWGHYENIENSWNAPKEELLAIEGVASVFVKRFCETRKTINLNKLEDDFKTKDIQVLTIDDEKYPYLLRHIYDPPLVLFIKGNLDDCDLDQTLAVVGSRKHSHYIAEILPKVLGGLAGSDTTVVSGMALGIDAIAHEAALANNLKTIAVLGGGLENVYPKQNLNLFNRIIDGNGAVISEYYPDEKPDPWKFPARNRIVSGLSKGTLVAEAGLKSGALITANITLDQGRELMCIPGLITNPFTAGINLLLKNGATVITEGEDILDYFGWAKDTEISTENATEKFNLLDNESKIYNTLSLEPKKIDEIANLTQLGIEDIMIVLTSMEIMGLIKQIPGEQYIRAL